MKVSVDFALCCGHGRCYALCPEVFLEDEAGYPVIECDAVPAEHEAGVRSAARNCPEHSISIED
jgi:ferredoxin